MKFWILASLAILALPNGGIAGQQFRGLSAAILRSTGSASVGGSAVFASDDFTGTNGDDIEGRTSSSGHTWGDASASVPNSFEINTNHGLKVTTDEPAFYLDSAPNDADYDVSQLCVVGNSGNTVPGPAGRMNTSNGDCYFVRYSGGGWSLYKDVGGTVTEIGSYTGDVPTGAGLTALLRMVGTTISLRINGVERISVTDSAISAAGRPGIRGYYGDNNSSTIYFDNFSATN